MDKGPFSADDFLSQRELCLLEIKIYVYSLKREEKAETSLITALIVLLFFFCNLSLICELSI